MNRSDMHFTPSSAAGGRRIRFSSLTVVSMFLFVFLGLMAGFLSAQPEGLRTDEKDLSMQREENSPMVVLTRTPPEPEVNTEDFEVREGFKLVDSLDEFRNAIKKDNQKIRLKPGVYRVKTVGESKGKYNHLLAVTGSGNHFDLRGTVIETPASTQDKLPVKPHVTHTVNIFGEGNTFEGGYFRSVNDGRYREFEMANNLFYIKGDNTTFRDCIFVIKGSFPYGYSDFFGKGGASWEVHPNNKYSGLMVMDVDNFELLNSELYQQSFGHGVHFHRTNSGRVEGCHLYGTVRPTNDIIEPGTAVPPGLDKDFTEHNVYSPSGRYERVGPPAEHGYRNMSRPTRPMLPNEMIPLTEDGLRSYDDVEDITVKDTYIERFRHCVTLFGPGDYVYDNVTVREAGNIAFQTSSHDGEVVLRNSRGDIAHDPLVDLTSRAPVPKNDFYEWTVLSARDPDVEKHFTSNEREAPKSIGSIHGIDTTFVFRDGKTRELPERFNFIKVDGHGLEDSVLVNLTTAEVRLNKKASDSLVISAGPVTGKNGKNKIKRIRFPDLYDLLLDDDRD